MIVCMVNRILSLLDKPSLTAVIRSNTDWSSAFDRTDPTKTVQKFIFMGIRPSLIPILIEFLTDRQMSVKFNQKESKIHKLIGGGEDPKDLRPARIPTQFRVTTMPTMYLRRTGTNIATT